MKKRKSNQGQGMLEYLILTALVALLCIGAVKGLGNSIRTRLENSAKRLTDEIPSDLRGFKKKLTQEKGIQALRNKKAQILPEAVLLLPFFVFLLFFTAGSSIRILRTRILEISLYRIARSRLPDQNQRFQSGNLSILGKNHPFSVFLSRRSVVAESGGLRIRLER